MHEYETYEELLRDVYEGTKNMLFGEPGNSRKEAGQH